MSPCVALSGFEIQETECVALFVYAIMKKMAKVFGVIVKYQLLIPRATSTVNSQISLITRKLDFRIFNQVNKKVVCSVKETS